MNQSGQTAAGWLSLLLGIAGASTSALITAAMLLVNGSLTLVVLRTLRETGNAFFAREGVLQFGLFVIPVVLCTAQWIAWDILTGIVWKEQSELDADE
ncbi:MAG: hypothetical protein AAFV88_08045, partial [Planctomycetota bacterium]